VLFRSFIQDGSPDPGFTRAHTSLPWLHLSPV